MTMRDRYACGFEETLVISPQYHFVVVILTRGGIERGVPSRRAIACDFNRQRSVNDSYNQRFESKKYFHLSCDKISLFTIFLFS